MTGIATQRADLTDPGLHASGQPHELWRQMRQHAPAYWHPPAEYPGFWSLTRCEDIRAAYRNTELFSSASGVLLRPAGNGGDPGAGKTLALTDPPRHKQLRALIADRFSTRSVRSLEEQIRQTARDLLVKAAVRGECDFAHDVAARLSLYVISGILGAPPKDWENLFEWTNAAFKSDDPKSAALGHQRVMQYFAELMYQRMTQPADDVVTALVHGTVNNEPLTEEEIILNCENLVGATENGRIALIGGMLAFLDHPDQWERLCEQPELMSSAVEEVLRWTSSATHSQRTITRSTVLHGQRLAAGDRMVMWIPSANRDENVFTDPERFDITRTPNRHLSFGSGEHFCIGSNLARAQLRILFSELSREWHGVEQAGPALLVRSIAINGPRLLPVRINSRRGR
jgi:cytochrome P450